MSSAQRVRMNNLQAERLGDRGNWGELSQRLNFCFFAVTVVDDVARDLKVGG